MRRRPSPLRLLRTQARGALAAVSSHPRRAAMISAVGLFLVWLVLTKSLAFAVAETSPELALWLNPNLPRALLTVANRERDKLIAMHAAIEAPPLPSASAEDPAPPPAPTFTATSEDGSDEHKALRADIRILVSRAIANSPLNARAFRMLAEVTDDTDQVRLLMQGAIKRSRREAAAAYWLMNDSFARKDLADVVANADILMRTKPKLAPYVMNYLGRVAETPEGRSLLAAQLASNPDWRVAFFKALPKNVQDEDTPLDLMVLLKDEASPPSPVELSPYLTALVTKKRVELAYNAWLQLAPQEKLASLSLLNNAGFAEDPSGLPFDWFIRRGQNSTVDFVALKDRDGERGLRFSFGVGRAKFPEISQILMLAPGLHRFEGTFEGPLIAKRGLRWEFRCLDAKTPLAETEMFYGNPRSAQSFALEFEIPDSEDCRAQKLRLYHNARSSSEELISGEIVFRGIRLVRLK